ncbi:MAG: 23S rRNA (adenine(2503)-C(2))-methyltransferase RlmN, partial [Pseudomonadota bacterium]|nr:23S rRNA (adenine(2503)-C(2))-methyltransferase RlmN [Pseudomonadota bacterium]
MTSISAPVPPTPVLPASVAPDAGTAADLAPRKVDLIGLSRAELVTEMARMQLPRFRADQLWHWIYHKGVTDLSAMTTLAKPLRANLSGYYTIGRLAVSSRQESQDGTIKWLFRLADGHEIETVFIPEDDRGTLCISSQVGCTLNCRFCHTGTQRLVRNLTAGEIVGQLMAVFDDLADWPSGRDNRYVTSIVMMGMGEPLYNYDNVRTALKIIMDEAGIALSRRRITLSTTGIIPQMQACGEELAVNL